MANLTFQDKLAVATFVFAVLAFLVAIAALLCVLPHVIVAFGYFPESGFA